MTSCADVRAELVALLRGETDPATTAEVEKHLAVCVSCAAERESLERTLALVGSHVNPEVSADARLRMSDALSEEFARPRRRGVRRVLRPVFLLPASLAAGVLAAWLSVGATPSPIVHSAHAAARAQRAARAADVAGELGTKALDAAARGLAWLTASQRADGAWASSADADPAATSAATASALLAFAADGQSPHHGPRAAALRRARDRLAELVDAGFSTDGDQKPLYALALAVRALATTYRLDHDAMSDEERRGLRDVLGAAGRRLVDWQGADGGFGYVPRAPRSDSSCTLFAAAALKDLREAGLMDAGGAGTRAAHYVESLPAQDGGVAYMRPCDRRAAPALTAAWLALDPMKAAPPEGAVSSVESGLVEGRDALLAWSGFEALAQRGRALSAPLKSLLAEQRPDGAWTAAEDRRCACAGDAVTTAFGVMALARVYTQ